MTPSQSRAARGLLNWNQDALANAADVSSVTVRNFENEKATPQRATLAAMRRALEAAGVIFVEENGEGPGVRMSKRILELRAKVADLRNRVEAAKSQVDKQTANAVDNIGATGSYDGLETEEALAAVFANLSERAALLIKTHPNLKGKFPEIL